MESKREKNKRIDWDVIVSPKAKVTVNPIRCVVETLKLEPNPEKQMIPLSIGTYLELRPNGHLSVQ